MVNPLESQDILILQRPHNLDLGNRIIALVNGNLDLSQWWLTTPLAALDGRAPLDLMLDGESHVIADLVDKLEVLIDALNDPPGRTVCTL